MKSKKRAIRTAPEKRKKQILECAIQLSKKIGYKSITRDPVADLAKVTSSLVAYYYPRMSDLEAAVLREAIDKEIFELIAQGLLLKDPIAMEITTELKKKTNEYIKSKI